MTPPDRIKTPDAFWQAAERLSIRRSALIHEAQLPPGIVQRDARMSTAQLFALWHALEVLGGADVGFDLSTQMQGATMPPSLMVAFHASNLGEALRRVARFKALTAPEEFQITSTAEECVVITNWPHANETQPNALTDASFAFLVSMARVGTETEITPDRMDLCRDRSEKIETWFGCPVNWNAPTARLVFRKSDLDIRFVSYNRELLEMLDEALDQELSRHQTKGSLSDQVRWHLRRCLTAGRPELRSIARQMAISERSLQRRLREEGQSFQALLSDTRHSLACEYLSEPAFDITEIVCLLGYEDQGSFYRAFHKWEDRTPAEWREAHFQTDQPKTN
ncbi:AraC family transcriptional regulator [Ruegeria arenilitoris]|uniref:AraC family transcriptional regulator n=1 Tax=Ruegeria arenilitoris TaxID=1173585 RepID=UPI00147FE714|nr:AraC family transcriptional regulator [Ruegeria arenilitoris]